MIVSSRESAPLLTVRALRAVGVEVPMTYALGTSRATIATAPLLLIGLRSNDRLIPRISPASHGPRAPRRRCRGADDLCAGHQPGDDRHGALAADRPPIQ